MTLDEEVATTLTAVESCIKRLRSVHELRASEAKSISPQRTQEARRIASLLNNLIAELPADPSEAERLIEELEMKSRKVCYSNLRIITVSCRLLVPTWKRSPTSVLTLDGKTADTRVRSTTIVFQSGVTIHE
jgi:hypothetical protein